MNNIYCPNSFFLEAYFRGKYSVGLRYSTLFQTNTYPTRHVSELKLLINK